MVGDRGGAASASRARAIVNSISLKEGEGPFLEHARKRARAMAPRSSSWLSTSRARRTRVERKVAICERSYRLLTEKAGFAPEDIIFDPNIFAVATGIEEHADYGRRTSSRP